MLLTGHTGFKGAWLCAVAAVARRAGDRLLHGVPTEPSLYELARVGDGQWRASRATCATPRRSPRRCAGAEPEIVIHMAAQSLVRRSFAEPRETYETNVMGTVNVLDAVRAARKRRARDRQRDLGQVLREPRVGVGLPRGRADGRPRSLLELQGLRRARDATRSAARSSPTPTGRAWPPRARAT